MNPKHITVLFNNTTKQALLVEENSLVVSLLIEGTGYKIAMGIYSDALERLIQAAEFPSYVVINDFGEVINFVEREGSISLSPGLQVFSVAHDYGLLNLEDLEFFLDIDKENLDKKAKMRDNNTEIGKKYDNEKPRTDLLPPRALMEVAKVLGFGAEKYGPDNWKKLEDLQRRYTGAALRHIFDHMAGLEFDNETGIDHIAHAICCLLFKLEAKLIDAEDQTEGLRESLGGEHRESYLTYESGGTRKAYNKKGSVRNSEHFVQYHET